MNLADVLSLPEVEQLALGCMSTMAYEYVTAAAADEHTVRWNRESYDRIRLRPRVLRDIANPDTRVTLFGKELPAPIILAPAAYQRLMHTDGELAMAKGAGAANTTFVVSSASTTSLEDIAGVATSPFWFQLYVQSDRGFTRDQIRRAEAAGCTALCLTVDTPTLGARNRQVKAKFELPIGVTTPHLSDGRDAQRQIIDPTLAVVTWRDVDWMVSFAKVPLLLKGILDPDDAKLAVKAGAAGIIVSNHGARNLDTTPATIDALPAVVDKVGGRVPVLVDGGIRRGTDVLKAIACGATAVMIGRPYCYGLALAGADGVKRVIDILRQEFEMAMMLTGRGSLAEIDASVLWDGMPS
jgi:4-hydroxymandelate oxidase